MKKTMFTDQRGVGLIPFLISAGVIGLIIAGISSSILTMIRSQVSVAASAEATLLAEQLQATLSNEGSCVNALSGRIPNAGTALENVPVRLGDQDAILSEGSDLPSGQGFNLANFRMAIEDAPFVGSGGVVTNGVPTFNDGSDPVRNHRVKVSFQLRKTSDGIFSPLSQKKEFFIDANIKTADSQIKSCAARSVASQACFQMGGIWNTSIEPDPVTGLPVDGNRCKSNQFCQYGGSYADPATPAEARFPNSFMTPPSFSCPTGFNRKQTGALALANAVSKSEIRTTVAPIYSCLRCVQTDRAGVVAGVVNTSMDDLNALITEAQTEGDTFANIGNVFLRNTCLNALSTSGDWSAPTYSQNECGEIVPMPPNPCHPNSPTYTDSRTCDLSYFDGFTYYPYTGTSTMSTTCQQVRALPPACRTP